MRRGIPGLLALLMVVAALGGWAWWSGHNREPAPTSGRALADRAEPIAGWGTLRALTANVRLDEPQDGDNAWIKRRDLVVKTILKHQPDVLGCQELAPVQAAFLEKELSRWYTYYPRAGAPGGSKSDPPEERGGTTRTAGKSALGLAAQLIGAMTETVASLNTLFYRTDRFELIDGESGLVLPEKPQPVATENTFFTLAVLREKEAGANRGEGGKGQAARTLIVVNVHFRHSDAFAAQCAQRVREKIQTYLERFPDSGVLLLGDMNHGRGSALYAALTEKSATAKGPPLVDGFDYSRGPAVPGGGTWGTYHGFSGVSMNSAPTDLIFCGGALALVGGNRIEILRDHADEGNPPRARWPSDHFFVLGEFVFSGK